MAEPAIEELRRALISTFPEIFPGQDPTIKKHMPRLQAAPGGYRSNPKYDSSKDPHVAGLALDIILLAWVGRERKLAENLVDLFVYYKSQMGWSAVIYNHVTTDDFGGPKPQTGPNPDTTQFISNGRSHEQARADLSGRCKMTWTTCMTAGRIPWIYQTTERAPRSGQALEVKVFMNRSRRQRTD